MGIDSKGDPEVERRDGSRSSDHYTNLVNSALVANDSATPSEEGTANADTNEQQAMEFDRLAIIRAYQTDQMLIQASQQYSENGLREKASKDYNYTWKQWVDYCQNQGCSPI